MEPKRCQWCLGDPLYVEYHDIEWGAPVVDDVRLFEMLILEGAQAGLSWLTILKKRQGYRKAFADFDFETVARFSPRRIEKLLLNPEIVRNRLKVESAVRNARAVMRICESHGSLSEFLWRYVEGEPIQNAWTSMDEMPSRTDRSDSMSKDLKKLGCNFVGSTICYAFMQAVGMVNDHLTYCFRHEMLKNSER
ncbi:MAG: DNA-3-methyladenine glycosylase I [Phycisphaerae bacterium]|jgi:DNA-3-methyladenine glycosylase I|nr:DNA-3-methyladenine glycosylase I [Phycisphaerae bacterium]